MEPPFDFSIEMHWDLKDPLKSKKVYLHPTVIYTVTLRANINNFLILFQSQARLFEDLSFLVWKDRRLTLPSGGLPHTCIDFRYFNEIAFITAFIIEDIIPDIINTIFIK